MKKRGRRVIYIMLLCFLFAILASPVRQTLAATFTASGTCGANVKWYLYNDGNLVIEGTGAMNDYGYSDPGWWAKKSLTPWNDYKDSIKSISIGEGVTLIGEYAFENLTNLTEVNISSTVTTINDYAFSGCSALQQVIIPDNVSSVGKYLFKNCIYLKQAYISGSIVKAERMFYGCIALKEVAIPKKMETISEGMFYKCTALEEVRFDETVTSIGKEAFYGCSALKSLNSDYKFTTIEIVDDYAFYGCTSLTEILDVSVKMGYKAYAGCNGLKNVIINAASMDDAVFYECKGIESAVVSENLGRIPASAFKNASSLTKLTINGISTSIYDATAFEGCALTFSIVVVEDNRSVIDFCIENNISYTNPTISIGGLNPGLGQLVGGISDTLRAGNTNHASFFDGETCSVTSAEKEGKVISGSGPYASEVNDDIRYADGILLDKNNYTSYADTAPSRQGVGISKIYFYGKYIENGYWYCAVAKAAPVMAVENISLPAGEVKALSLALEEISVVTYTSSNATVATISDSGVITAKSVGSTTIRIYVASTENYRATVKEITVTVKEKPVNNANNGSNNGGNTTTVPIVYKQTITAASKTVAYKSKAFRLNAKASAGGKLTYKSNNTKVAKVSKTGKVTVKNYGKATITIKAAAIGNYPEATKKITIKVVPKKMTLKSAKATGKKRIKISWKKDSTATGYQIYISQKKNFKSKTIQRFYKKNKLTATVDFLKRNKTYYVKVRAYKTVGKTKYYGSWSKVKRVKVK